MPHRIGGTYVVSPIIRRCKVCGTATASANRLCTWCATTPEPSNH